MTEVDPYSLFQGNHPLCGDHILAACPMCFPKHEPAYVMMVGEKYYPTPEDFTKEAARQGISKRIPFIPKNLVLGDTWIFLAHNQAVTAWEDQTVAVKEDKQLRLIDAPVMVKRLGIFGAFRPQRIETLVRKSNATQEYVEQLGKRGITPVIFDDGDLDHEVNTKGWQGEDE